MKINYFKSEKANKAFGDWISNYPESFHPIDMKRFAKMVITILDEGEDLEMEYIKEAGGTRLSEWMVNTYMSRYQSMKDMYELLIGESRLLLQVEF